jgi:hypothetical protein
MITIKAFIGYLLLAVAIQQFLKKIVTPLLVRRRHMKQGVEYLSVPFVSEILAFAHGFTYKPEFSLLSYPTNKIIEQNNGRVPPLTGMCLLGDTLVSINSVEYLDDVYINKNNLNTK